jgi:hypothetical protein
MRTPLYPLFKKRINDAIDKLDKEQVTPWAFLTAGPLFQIKTFDGKQIQYKGIEFGGSPRLVFWTRYIEPFLENICIAEIAAAVVMAKEKEIDGRLLLTEVRTLLAMGFTRIYNRMADIDRKLRGKGFPKQVELRSVEREIAIMNHFLDEHIQSEIEMWKTNSKLEEWFKKNQFWVWIASVVLAIIALLIKFK